MRQFVEHAASRIRSGRLLGLSVAVVWAFGFAGNAHAGSVTPSGGFPTTIAAGGVYNSPIIPLLDRNAISASVQSTQAGTLTVQRYLDNAGNIPIGSAVTQAIVANTLETVNVQDGLAALSFKYSVTNTGGVTATISNAAIVTGQH